MHIVFDNYVKGKYNEEVISVCPYSVLNVFFVPTYTYICFLKHNIALYVIIHPNTKIHKNKI